MTTEQALGLYIVICFCIFFGAAIIAGAIHREGDKLRKAIVHNDCGTDCVTDYSKHTYVDTDKTGAN